MANIHGAGDSVALLYSGGMESNLMLSLATPWKSQTTVFTTLTGVEFPHMRSFIETSIAGWSHVIARSDIQDYFQNKALPANVIPIENLAEAKEVFGLARRPYIIPWIQCCLQNRSEPAWQAVREAAITKCIHGQRKGDFAGERKSIAVEGLMMFAPLEDFSRQEVRDMCFELQVSLPTQYGEFDSSLDCSICPASLTPSRRSWMARHYHQELILAEQLQGLVSKAVLEALSGEHTFHNRS
jgi:3'-phosphoadenosine 5'-phosphosulfate sulfotransferase (PAPS reductase)/FAD synthetase